MADMTKPTTKPVARRTCGDTRYQLFSNGQLWTAGRHGYFCGYVSDPENIDLAIDNHEEEMCCLMADAMAEFA